MDAYVAFAATPARPKKIAYGAREGFHRGKCAVEACPGQSGKRNVCSLGDARAGAMRGAAVFLSQTVAFLCGA